MAINIKNLAKKEVLFKKQLTLLKREKRRNHFRMPYFSALMQTFALIYLFINPIHSIHNDSSLIFHQYLSPESSFQLLNAPDNHLNFRERIDFFRKRKHWTEKKLARIGKVAVADLKLTLKFYPTPTPRTISNLEKALEAGAELFPEERRNDFLWYIRKYRDYTSTILSPSEKERIHLLRKNNRGEFEYLLGSQESSHIKFEDLSFGERVFLFRIRKVWEHIDIQPSRMIISEENIDRMERNEFLPSPDYIKTVMRLLDVSSLLLPPGFDPMFKNRPPIAKEKSRSTNLFKTFNPNKLSMGERIQFFAIREQIATGRRHVVGHSIRHDQTILTEKTTTSWAKFFNIPKKRLLSPATLDELNASFGERVLFFIEMKEKPIWKVYNFIGKFLKSDPPLDHTIDQNELPSEDVLSKLLTFLEVSQEQLFPPEMRNASLRDQVRQNKKPQENKNQIPKTNPFEISL